jgi:K+-sensing histidine kinase KdpD
MIMNTIDHNALLLQVMAHDLLAPLTAIKWQIEIMAKEGPADSKFAERLQGVHDSTHLGITLTKHAHVAGRVLVGSYEQDNVATPLADIVRESALNLKYQYERHGLTLEVEIDADPTEYEIDTNLLKLLVWSIAKYFLSSAPAHTVISFRGISAPNAEGKNLFVLIGSAPNIPDTDNTVKPFSATEASGPYDQAFVFAKLIHTISPLVGAAVSASAQGSSLVIEVAFDRT